MKKRFNIFIANAIRIILGLSTLAGILSNNPATVFMSVFTLVLTFLPVILTRRWDIHLSESLQVVIIVFIFAANYLGELNDFYYKFYWWDDMLHSMSGVVLAMIGFLLVDSLNRYEIKNMSFHLSPFFVAFFSLVFAIAAGAVWEIFEYIMDTFFGMNMQKYMIDPQKAVEMGFGVSWQGPGLNDTMHDLILDALGALVVEVIVYVKLRYEKHKADKEYLRDEELKAENDN